jgi:endogenous inhibitor of DNA gyrase (YacG/DUF329 family)
MSIFKMCPYCGSKNIVRQESPPDPFCIGGEDAARTKCKDCGKYWSKF